MFQIGKQWNSISPDEAKRHPYYGLGGWLLVFYLGIAYSVVEDLLIGFAPELASYVGITYSVQEMATFYQGNTQTARFMLLLGVAWTIPFLVLSPLKHRLMPKVAIWSIWLSFILQAITWRPPTDVHAVTGAISFLAIALLVTWYFLASKRVNVTYLHRVLVKSETPSYDNRTHGAKVGHLLFWVFGGLLLLAVVGAILEQYFPSVSENGKPSQELLDANRKSQALYEKQEYSAALPVAKMALELAERDFGTNNENTAQFQNNLAEIYRNLGNYDDAEPLFTRALKVIEKAYGPDNSIVATTLNNLGEVYSAQGRNGDAEPLIKRALRIRENTLGPDHPSVAVSLHSLGLLHGDQGNFALAEPLFTRALKIAEKAHGPNHPNVAAILTTLAGLYSAQGRYSEAEPLYNRAIPIMEKTLRPGHPDVAVALENYAALLRNTGRDAQASEIERRAQNIRTKLP